MAPAQTFYAACANNNIVSTANNQHPINAVNYNPSTGTTTNQVQITSDTTAYDCCVSCQKTLNCIGSSLNAGQCSIIIGNACNAANTNTGASFTSRQGSTAQFSVSNGPCGQVANGGDVPA